MKNQLKMMCPKKLKNNVWNINAIMAFIFLIVSCSPKPKLEISNDLEIALKDNYSNYVINVNKAIEKDTVALLDLMRINNIYDSAGYDHGLILIKLMETIGDKEFSKLILKMDMKERDVLKDYFRAGLDSYKKYDERYFLKYPLTSKILNIK